MRDSDDILKERAVSFLGRSYDVECRRNDIEKRYYPLGQLSPEQITVENTDDILLYAFIGHTEASCKEKLRSKLGFGYGDESRRSYDTIPEKKDGCLLIAGIATSHCTLREEVIVEAAKGRENHAFIRSGDFFVGYCASITFFSNYSLDTISSELAGKSNSLASILSTVFASGRTTHAQHATTEDTKSIAYFKSIRGADPYFTGIQGIGYYPQTSIMPGSLFPLDHEESCTDRFNRLLSVLHTDFKEKCLSIRDRQFSIAKRGIEPYDKAIAQESLINLKTLLGNYKAILKILYAVRKLMGEEFERAGEASQLIRFGQLQYYSEKVKEERAYLKKFSGLPSAILKSSFKKYDRYLQETNEYLEFLNNVPLIAAKQPVIIQLTATAIADVDKTNAVKKTGYLSRSPNKNLCAIDENKDRALPLEIDFEGINNFPYLDQGLNEQKFYLKLSDKKNKYLKISNFPATLFGGAGAGICVVGGKDKATLWQMHFINGSDANDMRLGLKSVTEGVKKYDYVLAAHYAEKEGICYIKTDHSSVLRAAPIFFESKKIEHDFRTIVAFKRKYAATEKPAKLVIALPVSDIKSEALPESTSVTAEITAPTEKVQPMGPHAPRSPNQAALFQPAVPVITAPAPDLGIGHGV